MQYDYDRFLQELGQRVKNFRLGQGMTHRQMVLRHGFHLNQLHRIERGDPVSVQTLLKLCAAFDLKLEDLVKGLGVEAANPETPRFENSKEQRSQKPTGRSVRVTAK